MGMVMTRYQTSVEAGTPYTFDVRQHYFPSKYTKNNEQEKPHIDATVYHLMCQSPVCEPYLTFNPTTHIFRINERKTKNIYEEITIKYMLLFKANYIESYLLYLEITITPKSARTPIIPVLNITEPYVPFYFKNRHSFKYVMVEPGVK